MTAEELRQTVEKFADRPSDVVLGKDRLVVEVHGQLIEAGLKQKRGGILYCLDGGIEEPAETWIERRLGQLDVLATRILDYVPEDPALVSVEADVLATIDQDVTEKTAHVEDAVEALSAIICGLPAASTDVLYLTSDAGEGKTCVMEALARKKARDYLDGNSDWILLPVSLSGRPFLRLDEVVVGTLSNRFRFRFLYYEGVLELVKRGSIVLGLDGFEEMFVETQTGEVVSSLGNLVARLGSQGALLFAARKAYYHYTNLHAQARLFDAIRDANVAFAEIRLKRWQRPQFVQCCLNQAMTTEEADEAYEAFRSKLGETHPVLTRAVLARKAIDEVVEAEDGVSFAEKLGNGDSSPEDTFERFVDALIEREAIQKWIDRSGEVAAALLPANHHHVVLMAIAEEMWQSGLEVLSGELLETTTEMVVDALGHSASTVGQARDRIKQHALLRRVAGSEQYGFDHEEFRAFYLGRRLGELMLAKKSTTVRQLLSPKPLPDLSVRVASRALMHSVNSDHSAIEFLCDIASAGARGTYARTNASNMVLRCLSLSGGNGILLKDMHFTSGSASGLAFACISFERCTFEHLDIRHVTMSDVAFTGCEIIDFICEDDERGHSGTFDRESLPEVIHIGGGDDAASCFAPEEQVQLLNQLGFSVQAVEGNVDEAPPLVFDPRILEVEKVFRAFRRSTQLNVNVMQMRLSHRWKEFDKHVLPELTKRNILIDVQNRGSGTQRRFKMGVGFDDFERACENCHGDYIAFLNALVRR